VIYNPANNDEDLVGLIRSSIEHLKKEAQSYNCKYCVFIGQDPLYTSYTHYEASTHEEALSYTKGHRNCMIFRVNQ
jgi:hypothetical protein